MELMQNEVERNTHITSVDTNIQILNKNVARLNRRFVSHSHNFSRCSEIRTQSVHYTAETEQKQCKNQDSSPLRTLITNQKIFDSNP